MSMTNDELSAVRLYLAEAFPTGNIPDAQFDVFEAAVRSFTKADVIEGIQAYAARTMFPNPTIAEIVTEIKCVMRKETSGAIKKFSTAIARSMASRNPAWADKPEREVVVSGHNANWRAFIDWATERSTLRKIDRTPEEQQQVDNNVRRFKEECAGDLRLIGMTEEEIDAWSSASVVEGYEEFKLTVKHLRGDPIADPAMSY